MRGATVKLGRIPALLVGGMALLALAGCGRAPEVDLPPTPTGEPPLTASPVASATPTPPDSVIVCLAQEPESLYLYGDTNRAADEVLSVVYDGPVDLVGYEQRPVMLEKLPRLADDDAEIEVVSLAAGDVYFNPETLEPDTLGSGKPYAPSGCRSGDCLATYNGGSVELDRLRARFEIAAGTVWSDGEPLRASDSVFSYEIDGDPDTPTPKYLYARTYSYRALDETTVEWIGIPGFMDAEFQGNFWTPLPEHVLGEFSAAELLQADAAVRMPLGWGPYRILEWQAGAEIRLQANEFYRGESGPPAFEQMVFRFVGQGSEALAQLSTGECDVLSEAALPQTEAASMVSRAEAGGFALAGGPGPVVERLDFNLNPVEGAAPFADVATRRGLSACIDRQALAEQIAGPYAASPVTFVPSDHPLSVSAPEAVQFDPEHGRASLQQAGWMEAEGAGAGARTAFGVTGVPDGTELAFDLYSLAGDQPEQVAQTVAADLEACGADVSVQALPAEELFASWPDGPAFGRRFGAVIWAWPSFASPACEMFAGWEVPSDERPLGINASGYANSDYDAACRTMLLSPPGTAEFDQAASRLQFEFAADVPGVGLFQRPRLIAHADWLCGVELDGSVASSFWSAESWRPCSQPGAP